MLIIRRIHHFGYKVWLGGPERIKSFAYEKIDGVINIMTSKGQYIVPRQKESNTTTIVALYKKKIYNIRKKELLKEIVLVNNEPKVIDYEVSEHYALSDDGKGIKGYIKAKNGKKEHEIIIV